MSSHTILFLTDRSPRHQQAAIEGAPNNCEVVMLRRPPRAELLAQLASTDFLISERAGVVDAEMVAAGTQLRLIQRLGSLTHDIDLAAAQDAGIPVCAMPVPGCVLVAEHMLMQMLALIKRLPDAAATAGAAGDWGRPSLRTDENTFAYNWSGRAGISGLWEKTIGIVGFGEIGAELARRLRSFLPARVLYHKRTRYPAATEADLGITYAEPAQIYTESDILCSLLPFFPETDQSLNEAVFAMMQPGAQIVHCGSGSVIDEHALAAALRDGHLGGAALDTFEWEPLTPDNPLVPLAREPAMNVLLTPHTAAGSGSGYGGRERDYVNIVRLLAGDPLLYRVT
jgi:phosphoglycerate dehydrogenase-like enzyme